MKLLPAMWIAFVVLGAACGKKDKEKDKEKDKPAATEAAAPSSPVVTPAPAVPTTAADGCVAGAYKPPSNAFCADAPGYKGEEAKNGPFVTMILKEDNSPEVDINWNSEASASDYDDRIKVMEDNSKLKAVKLEDHGDLTGAVTGKWVQWSTTSGTKHEYTDRTFVAVIKGKKSNFNCETHWTNDAPGAAKATAICKTLRPLL